MNTNEFIEKVSENLRPISYGAALITAVVLGLWFTQTPQLQDLTGNKTNSSASLVGNNQADVSSASLGTIGNGVIAGIDAADFNPDFRLTIPKIGLSQPVKAEVDPANADIYAPVINQQVAHGLGTRLPDEAILDGNVYLFAHRNGTYNGRKIGFFNRLDQLNVGDSAVISYNGSSYEYKLREKFVITPQDTWVYTDDAQTPTLTLQTCENGETQRLIVQFDLVAVRA